MSRKTGSKPTQQNNLATYLDAKIKSLKKMDVEKVHTARLGITLIVLGVILVILLSLSGVRTFITLTVKSGISAFAVAYLMAQLIERALEPFSEIKLGHEEIEGQLFSDTTAIKILSEEIKAREEANKKKTSPGPDLELAKLQEQHDKLAAKRTIAFWGLTSFLGILLCFMSLGLFEIAGVTFSDIVIASGTITGHTVDSILSGMIVGAGTKPLHDLIGYLEK